MGLTTTRELLSPALSKVLLIVHCQSQTIQPHLASNSRKHAGYGASPGLFPTLLEYPRHRLGPECDESDSQKQDIVSGHYRYKVFLLPHS
jgi:hypothetical protein